MTVTDTHLDLIRVEFGPLGVKICEVFLAIAAENEKLKKELEELKSKSSDNSSQPAAELARMK